MISFATRSLVGATGGVPGVVFVSIGMSMRRLISFEGVRRKWLAFYC